MKRKNTVATAGAAAAALTLTLALGACSSGASTPAQSDSPAAAKPAATSTASPGNTTPGATTPAGDEISPIDAIDAALKHTAGEAVEVEAEDHRGTAVWEVTIRTADGSGVEVSIDRASGDVVADKKTDIDEDQRETPKVSITAAIDAVLAAEPGTLREIKLDSENSTQVWEAEVRATSGDHVEIYLDATTGDVIKHEVDD